MAEDAGYQELNYRQQGGKLWVVGSTGSLEVYGTLDMKSGSVLKADGTQASAIGRLSTTNATTPTDTIVATASTSEAVLANAASVDANFVHVLTKINALEAAIEGAGISAST